MICCPLYDGVCEGLTCQTVLPQTHYTQANSTDDWSRAVVLAVSCIQDTWQNESLQ